MVVGFTNARKSNLSTGKFRVFVNPKTKHTARLVQTYTRKIIFRISSSSFFISYLIHFAIAFQDWCHLLGSKTYFGASMLKLNRIERIFLSSSCNAIIRTRWSMIIQRMLIFFRTRFVEQLITCSYCFGSTTASFRGENRHYVKLLKEWINS